MSEAKSGAAAAAQEKGPVELPGLRHFGCWYLVIHTAHTAHSTARHSGGPAVFLRPFGDHGFRGDQKPGDRRCILQRRPYDLGRVDDALGDEIDVLAVLGIEAVGVLILLEDLADDDRTVFSRIDG